MTEWYSLDIESFFLRNKKNFVLYGETNAAWVVYTKVLDVWICQSIN